MKKKIFGILITLMLAVSLLMVPAAVASADDLLEDSFSYEQDGWLFVHLEGTPYQRGYQNGYLTAEIANYWFMSYLGTGAYAEMARDTVQNVIWPLIPEEYQKEIDGIVAGLHARGYTNWDRWDVAAANAWADIGAYAGGCSAFVATGDATTDGQVVIGHTTWSSKATDSMIYVMFDVTPDEGYRFRYQGAGGSIWSGQEWDVNETGLMVTKTWVGNPVRNPEGTPQFVRIRQAVQYTDNLNDFIDVMTTNNNGSFPCHWLAADAKTGEILSLMLGCNAWDINRTFNGFFPACNYPYYDNFRAEAGYPVPAPDPPTSARAIRWLELIDKYYGRVDVEAGKLMLADDILAGYSPTNVSGGYDGNVTSTALVLDDNMGMWSRWGNPAGKEFDLEAYLADKTPEWIARHQEDIANLQRYVDRTPNPWTYLVRAIDIKPGGYPNSINLDSKGVVPVAVLTTDYFDASTVNPGTVEFAGTGAVRWTLDDVDGDGDMDMLFHFRAQEMNLTRESTEATLTGETVDGQPIKGTDTVNIVPAKD